MSEQIIVRLLKDSARLMTVRPSVIGASKVERYYKLSLITNNALLLWLLLHYACSSVTENSSLNYSTWIPKNFPKNVFAIFSNKFRRGTKFELKEFVITKIVIALDHNLAGCILIWPAAFQISSLSFASQACLQSVHHHPPAVLLIHCQSNHYSAI